MILGKLNKYHAKRSGPFDSQAELEYGEVLELEKRAGEIKDYIHHPPAIKMYGRIRYEPDYLVTGKDGKQCYVEVKGDETGEWRIKFNWLKENCPLSLFVVQKYGTGRFRCIAHIDKIGNFLAVKVLGKDKP